MADFKLPVYKYVKQDSILNLVYPVGSIYMSVNQTSPETLFGGTWEQIKGKFLYGCEDEGEDYVAGASSGRKTVTLTDTELPSHSHTVPAHAHSYDKATSLAGNSGNTSGTAISVAQTTSHNHCQSIEAAINYTSSANTYGYIMHGAYDSRYGKSWSSSSGSGNTHSHTLNGHSHTINYGTATSGNNTAGLTTYSTGSGTGFSIMPPYLAVYVWKRTA